MVEEGALTKASPIPLHSKRRAGRDAALRHRHWPFSSSSSSSARKDEWKVRGGLGK